MSSAKNPPTFIDLADGEYMTRKAEALLDGFPQRVTIAKIEREFGLKPNALLYYRANNYRK